MRRRGAFEREFHDVHGVFPDVDAEPHMEMRQEIPVGPGMTMSRVIQMRPRRGVPEFSVFQAVCMLPGIVSAMLILAAACAAFCVALYVVGAVIVSLF